MQDKLRKIQSDYSGMIASASSLKELDDIFLELFGKKGQLTQIAHKFANLSKEEVRVTSLLFNQIKAQLDKLLNQKRMDILEEGYKKLAGEKLELTPARIERQKGYLHPITIFEKEITDLFGKLGFSYYQAPHIDTDYYNFESLNIPAEHPARDLWDTLYIAEAPKYGYKEGELLLRTHTSNAQIRIMREYKLPVRMIVIDRLFRYENLDARHEHTTEQFEIVYIDKGLSMANLQYLSEYLLKSVLGDDIKVRLRPKYYPFVEPGAGVDGMCIFCKGKGCTVCGEVGWLELAGAGMIHPKVLQAGGIDPNQYSGIAWGFGPERMAMLKYGVSDIRLFKSGDLRFLNQIGEKINESK